jgi:hypothetical protein
MAVRSAAEEQREPLVAAMAALPERRARLAAEGSVVQAADWEGAAAFPLREVRRGPPRPEVHRGAPEAKEPEAKEPEAKEPEVRWASAGQLAAQGPEAEASREQAG